MVLEFTYIKLNVDKKNCTSFKKFNYIYTFHCLMGGARFFLSKCFFKIPENN
jgi:hypothetical protein